ncbi:putative oxidoreductase GLYR1 homolog [Trichonephila clavata]|uniref:Putative oxidoreductase GLYR1 homolog n=1 Tax=Trichonephila clavata TaxID=2740835 RepID=A0A8X6H2P8_TRICU|nr:putative oxidoreductase GLYR1 homolog [Trichonephila clavata]
MASGSSDPDFGIDQYVWISSTYVSFLIKTFLPDVNIPFWMGKIVESPFDAALTRTASKKTNHFVCFVGTRHCFWMLEENIHHLSDEMSCDASNLFLKTLQNVREARGLIAWKPEPANGDSLSVDEFTKLCAAGLNLNEIFDIPSSRDEKLHKTSRKSNGTLSRKLESASKKTLEKKRLAQDESDQKSSPVQKLPEMSVDYPEQNSTTNQTQSSDEDELYETTSEYSSDDSLELPQVKNTSLGKNVEKTPEKIGFLGMGIMTHLIVKHLLEKEHDVFIWNTTPEKCQKLVETKAQLCATPSEVVRNCDILFVCVSTSEPVKSLVFLDEGVLQELKNSEPETKMCIERTFIDPTTSREVTEYIINYGGNDA